ncbi:putative nuclease HARBI1 [Eupeodes corollae]|uniref:putative nuclease HARBI1 n=1 Tax=Eupeodes corollae TaxID=290404 RepID=UPI0024920B7A|nr:putative nuclease HARBI1 [Eupeodes corollae]
MPEERFRELFRFTREIAMILLEELRPHMTQGQRITFIPIPLRVCAALHFFASGSYQRDIGHDFSAAMSRSMISRCIREVSSVLHNKLMKKWIMFPSIEEYAPIKQRFFEKTGFPGVIGAIDCTHVQIQKPKREIEACYLNRKGFHSKNVQLICDFDLKILAGFARFAGATHDAYIWEASQVNSLLERRYEACELRDHNSWLLGDSGYPLRPWLITPYRAPAIHESERRFNTLHSKSRNCVERLNGVLKSVFRCLKLGLSYNPTLSGQIINACCVLHNIRLNYGIVEEFIFEEDAVSNEETSPDSTSHLRAATVIRDRLRLSICP